MPNLQLIEKRDLDQSGSVEIHHLFQTIQGEGPLAGTPAVFLRLAGCNLQCPLCDTDYTTSRLRLTPDQIFDHVKATASEGTKLVVITGGEPFRQNIVQMVEVLLKKGLFVQIETNGTLFLHELPYDHEFLTIVCSPKTGKIHPDLVPHIAAYKYILHADQIDAEDGLPSRALDHPAHPRVARPPKEIYDWADWPTVVFVQPCDEGWPAMNKRHLEASIKSCLKFGYTLSLQQHKLIGLE